MLSTGVKPAMAFDAKPRCINTTVTFSQPVTDRRKDVDFNQRMLRIFPTHANHFAIEVFILLFRRALEFKVFFQRVAWLDYR